MKLLLRAPTAILTLMSYLLDWNGLKQFVFPKSLSWSLKYILWVFFPVEEILQYKHIPVLIFRIGIKYNSQRQRQLHHQNPRNYVNILEQILSSLAWKCDVD